MKTFAANQQLSFGSYSMLYDANGNVTNIISANVTNRLFWSARNQLTNVVGVVPGSFLYDGLGRRTRRTIAGTTENYLYDGLDIILQKDSAGNVRGRYFRGLAIDEPWQRIDITPAQGQQVTTTNRVYLADALGSIVALTDTGKVIQTEYDYEPFGVTTTTGAGNKNSYKFTAREDDGTGLYYYRARYYHPVLGRFVGEDPLEMVDGNIYVYVYGNPINFVDPNGLDKDVPWLLIDEYEGEYSVNVLAGIDLPRIIEIVEYAVDIRDVVGRLVWQRTLFRTVPDCYVKLGTNDRWNPAKFNWQFFSRHKGENIIPIIATVWWEKRHVIEYTWGPNPGDPCCKSK